MRKIAVTFLAVVLTTFASAQPADVYIFSGQSNMVGSAKIARTNNK